MKPKFLVDFRLPRLIAGGKFMLFHHVPWLCLVQTIADAVTLLQGLNKNMFWLVVSIYGLYIWFINGLYMDDLWFIYG